MIRCELASRNQIRAFREGQQVLIYAEGELPSAGFDVDILESMLRIFPPQFNLQRCPKPGFFPLHATPYRYADTVRFPEDQAQITVHYADGTDRVDIEACGDELSGFVQAVRGSADRACPEGADQAVGLSPNRSFDEAFANAVANLPASDALLADALATVQVLEVGGLFGGFPGFHHLFVRVCRTIT